MELTLQEKRKLINFFEFLLDEEISKPLGEMNSEAVDNYIKILLHLQDKHVELSPDFIDEQVRKIFHTEETAAPETVKTTQKHYSKNKIWLVAACVAILVALFSILSFSSEKSVKDVLEDFIGTFEVIPFGKELDIGNETYGKGNQSRHYKSIQEFIENEKIALLYPKIYTNDITHISISETNEKGTITFTFNNDKAFMRITQDSELTEEILTSYNKIITLHGTDYYIFLMDDVPQVQAYFMYNNDLYTVSYTDENSLIEILNNMEEIKYED